MQLDPRDNRDAVYKLLIGCVVPRPIAWVSTVDAAGAALNVESRPWDRSAWGDA